MYGYIPPFPFPDGGGEGSLDEEKLLGDVESTADGSFVITKEGVLVGTTDGITEGTWVATVGTPDGDVEGTTDGSFVIIREGVLLKSLRTNT